ncbi:MAG: O-sialoglycoprotein endopeptidase [Caldicoprobacter oshimai]|uniref:N(6)-L-threonylcarbamoyladenine synthase n=1 Tax=Caldicoprobacter faecalis TaxID=937334 RepID=A0A1I5U7Q5_9FIRM|nr:O-sialoglycoprotein endopeptidase [Caldicoprobacter faecalis]SFP91321.1 N6-L-threonylcarbamoyladenine synthase [Caldicoprobacter faecalis]
MKYILGMDTSCYTTSVALVDLDGNVLLNRQIPLEVELGQRGLQQSKALFQHLHRLPDIASEIVRVIDPKNELAAVCATCRPRPVEGSYMPVFMVSHLTGQAFASMLGIPYYSVSHQESHIQAGIFSAGGPYSQRFLAIHLSGGTSELLKVTDRGTAFEIEIIGATQDLHAGQFVDRVGVAMGLPFPAGAYLEELARKGKDGYVTIPFSVKGLTISFSGPEAHAHRLLAQGIDKEDVAMAVYNCLVNTLERWILNAMDNLDMDTKDVLLVGGVASSAILRQKLVDRLKKRDEAIRLYFADPLLSRDNAVGTALLGLKLYKGVPPMLK